MFDILVGDCKLEIDLDLNVELLMIFIKFVRYYGDKMMVV